jgi:predicted 3-demethylubiquinone-9 3-methyltransferase (glyoxalase superfamily)
MKCKSITPFLWFDTQAEDAAKFYTSIFDGSQIEDVSHYGESGPREAGSVMTVSFTLCGLRFVALNGGPQYTFSEAVSFSVECDTQEEVDYFWSRLTSDGGEPGPCGWLRDKFGLAWQVVPNALPELLSSDDREGAGRAMAAMMQMSKIDIAELRRAYEGSPA